MDFSENPPFNELVSRGPDRAAEWEALKQRLPLRTTLTGKIFARAPFGVFFDAGLGFPVLIKVHEFCKPKKGGVIWPDDYPALGSQIGEQFGWFDDYNRQIGVYQFDRNIDFTDSTG